MAAAWNKEPTKRDSGDATVLISCEICTRCASEINRSDRRRSELLTTPRSGPRCRLDEILKTGDFAIAHSIDVYERRVESCAGRCLSAKATHNNDVLTSIDKLL